MIPVNLLVPTSQRAMKFGSKVWGPSTGRILSPLLGHDHSAPSTLQDPSFSFLRSCFPLYRGQSAGFVFLITQGLLNLSPLRLMYDCRHGYHEVRSGTGDACDCSSYMVSPFHYSPSYSAYRTQNASGAESALSLRWAHYPKSTGGHGQDVYSSGALLSAYSNATSTQNVRSVQSIVPERMAVWRPGEVETQCKVAEATTKKDEARRKGYEAPQLEKKALHSSVEAERLEVPPKILEVTVQKQAGGRSGRQKPNAKSKPRGGSMP
jgi:hypothetical protein